MIGIKQQVGTFAAELKKADRDAYIQWVTLTYEVLDNADPALFYIETGKLDMEYVKHRIIDITDAEEIELCPDYSMEVVNPKVYLEKVDLDVPVYNEKGKEPIIVPLVLSEYCINFTDYRDGIGAYLKTEFVDNSKTITGWVDSGNEQKVHNLKKLLVKFSAKILD